MKYYIKSIALYIRLLWYKISAYFIKLKYPEDYLHQINLFYFEKMGYRWYHMEDVPCDANDLCLVLTTSVKEVTTAMQQLSIGEQALWAGKADNINYFLSNVSKKCSELYMQKINRFLKPTHTYLFIYRKAS
jgi:hypothetical protein